jgi:hypothetical protein
MESWVHLLIILMPDKNMFIMIRQDTKSLKFTGMISKMKGLVTNCMIVVKVPIQLIDLAIKFKSLGWRMQSRDLNPGIMF